MEGQTMSETEPADKPEPLDLLAPVVPKSMTMDRDGKTYVLAAGLQDLLHRIAAHISGDGIARFTVETDPKQIPSDANGMMAVVQATVTILDANGVVIRRACQVGDADPKSVNRMMAVHVLRMAETRAIARCLRTLTNIGMAAFEELAGEEKGAGTDTDRDGVRGTNKVAGKPASGTDTWKDTKGNVYTRPQMLERYGVLHKMAASHGDQRPKLSDNTPMPKLAAECVDIKKAHPGVTAAAASAKK